MSLKKCCFNVVFQVFEDEELHELDPTLTNLKEGETYDQLNDDTFGSGALGKKILYTG